MKTPAILILCALVLISCETSKAVKSTSLAAIPQVLQQSCPARQAIGDDITNGELIVALARDRDNLELCRERHRVLVKALAERDRIQGEG